MTVESEMPRYRGRVVATLHREGAVYRLNPTCTAPLVSVARLWANPECARQAVREACEAAEAQAGPGAA